MTFESEDKHYDVATAIYSEPILEAYAIEYAVMKVHENIDEAQPIELLLDKHFSIEGGNIIRPNARVSSPFFTSDPMLTVHYNGIKNYSKLFPSVKDGEHANRLGNFYEEAEKNFDSCAWLSFSLMCGAIFEGLLYDLLGLNKKYRELIKKSVDNEQITIEEYNIMDNVRKIRNLVHMNKIDEPYVGRDTAMDIRKVLDDITVRFSKM